MKTIPISTTPETFPELWTVIWRGILGLTDQEANLFAAIIRKYEEHKASGLVEPYLSQLVLDTEARKHYQESLSVSPHNLRNLIAALRSKGAISDRDGSPRYQLDPRLHPVKQLLFDFNESK